MINNYILPTAAQRRQLQDLNKANTHLSPGGLCCYFNALAGKGSVAYRALTQHCNYKLVAIWSIRLLKHQAA